GTFSPGIGGGLCQLSNLIFWISAHTPLTITERHRHSFDVFPDSNRTQPFGSGATCSYNYLDLEIYNPTESTYQLQLWTDDTYLYGQWRSEHEELHTFRISEVEHSIHNSGFGPYIRHNELRKLQYNRRNELVSDEFLCENVAIMMYEPLLETSN
ncbi:MAG: VanW family protein, partial [Bacilli bacterium]